VPLDTHMFRICSALGFTSRLQADGKTALEITAAFRRIRPDDPIRYDFCLTRMGIRRDCDDSPLRPFMKGCPASYHTTAKVDLRRKHCGKPMRPGERGRR
jgi:hypothetical protein